jgi:hypothetical protein
MMSSCRIRCTHAVDFSVYTEAIRSVVYTGGIKNAVTSGLAQSGRWCLLLGMLLHYAWDFCTVGTSMSAAAPYIRCLQVHGLLADAALQGTLQLEYAVHTSIACRISMHASRAESAASQSCC